MKMYLTINGSVVEFEGEPNEMVSFIREAIRTDKQKPKATKKKQNRISFKKLLGMSARKYILKLDKEGKTTDEIKQIIIKALPSIPPKKIKHAIYCYNSRGKK